MVQRREAEERERLVALISAALPERGP
jgi:hypothetical protein